MSADFWLRSFYCAVSQTDSIFHLESLAKSPDFSHPEKKCFLAIAKLARVNVMASVQSTPSLIIFETNIFSRAVDHDSLDLLGHICSIYAQAASYVAEDTQGEAYVYIVETMYFAAVLTIRSIFDLAHDSRFSSRNPHRIHLTTLLHWLDATLCRCLLCLSWIRASDLQLLEVASALRGLVFACVFASVLRSISNLTTVHITSAIGVLDWSRPAHRYPGQAAKHWRLQWCTVTHSHDV